MNSTWITHEQHNKDIWAAMKDWLQINNKQYPINNVQTSAKNKKLAAHSIRCPAIGGRFQIFLLVAQGLSVLSVKKSGHGIAPWSFFSTFALRFGRNGKIDWKDSFGRESGWKEREKKFYFFLQGLKSFLPLQPGSERTKTEVERVVLEERVVKKGKKKVLFFSCRN